MADDEAANFLSLPSLTDADDETTASAAAAPVAAADSKTAASTSPGGSGDSKAVAASDPFAAARFRKATLTDALPTRFVYVANCGAARGDTDAAMRQVFARYGRIQAVVLPAAKPFSVVCFATPREAQRAMQWPTATQLGSRQLKMNFAVLRDGHTLPADATATATSANAPAADGTAVAAAAMDSAAPRKTWADASAAMAPAGGAEQYLKTTLHAAAGPVHLSRKQAKRNAALAAAMAVDGDTPADAALDGGGDGGGDAIDDGNDYGGGKGVQKYSAAPCTSSTAHVHVPGLHVIPEFLSEAEAEALQRTIDAQPWIHPPHEHRMGRRVQHYGYAFDYQTRTVDPTNRIGPLPAWIADVVSARLTAHPIVRAAANAYAATAPTAAASLRPTAIATTSAAADAKTTPATVAAVASATSAAPSPATASAATASTAAAASSSSAAAYEWVADQLTINEYTPGQGIRPHIDTHSAFADPIVSVSLGAHTVMDMRLPPPSAVVKHVHLPPRSALVLSGPARYLWSHGIARRKHDVLPMTALGGARHLATTTTSNSTGAGTASASSSLSSTATASASASSGPATGNGVAVAVPAASVPAGSVLWKRERRLSLTLRKVRAPQSCECEHTAQCDTYQKKRVATAHASAPRTSAEAEQLERTHVHAVYDAIATHFSHTRHSPWPSVEQFIRELPAGTKVADIGCGNAKYWGVNPALDLWGCDISANLVAICHERGHKQVVVGDALAVPFASGTFNVALSIAVLHHLSTVPRRTQAISELLRLLKPGTGRALICAWAQEQDADSRFVFPSPDVMVPWNLPQHHAQPTVTAGAATSATTAAAASGTATQAAADVKTPAPASTTAAASASPIASSVVGLTTAPAVSAGGAKPGGGGGVSYTVYNRYCHVYRKGELTELVRANWTDAQVAVEREYYDRGNWCVVLRKLK